MMRERRVDVLVLQAPAKLNLFLEVLGKRPDGYHELETLMTAINLEDTLEFVRDDGGKLSLTCSDPALACGPENLVLRAAERLRRHAGWSGGAKIHLAKRIPMQAGLAGGSSDAAATLKGLNSLWDLGLPSEELARLGADVGSDVPFFFSPGAAWCTGRGEKVEPMSLGLPLDFVLACPYVGLSTADVFRRVKVPADPASGTRLREAVSRGDVEAIGRSLHNRLQDPAEQLCPEVAGLRQALSAANPAGCLMTGSGTTVYALCRDRDDAIRVARTMGAEVADSPPHDGAVSHPLAGPAGRKWTLHVVRSCQLSMPQT
jgi:4-diphosphocytidyl-2-C-methyl-D-erythritol kinase